MNLALRTLGLGLAFLTAAMPSHAIEEPTFEVVRRIGDDIEIRQVKPYVVAEVVVDAPADKAGNEAFPILAGYIFGKNKGERKLEMTAPVTQAAQPVKMDMTVPVTQTPTAAGYVVQFVLPKDVTLATAPEPIDPRVKLREVPAQKLAVIRYSGFWSAANYDEHLAKLKTALAAEGMVATGEPVFSRYNAPFTPWFLRRNEIWLAVP